MIGRHFAEQRLSRPTNCGGGPRTLEGVLCEPLGKIPDAIDRMPGYQCPAAQAMADSYAFVEALFSPTVAALSCCGCLTAEIRVRGERQYNTCRRAANNAWKPTLHGSRNESSPSGGNSL